MRSFVFYILFSVFVRNGFSLLACVNVCLYVKLCVCWDFFACLLVCVFSLFIYLYVFVYVCIYLSICVCFFI